MFIDYYELLGINGTATSEEIKAAFRREIKKYHPDLNMGNGNVERTRNLIEAQIILLDKEAREKYYKERQQYKVYTNYSQETTTTTTDYEIQDEQLGKWIENAKQQAKIIYKEVVNEFKESANASLNGVMKFIIWYVIPFVIGGVIFRTCSGCNSQPDSDNPKPLHETVDTTITPINLQQTVTVENRYSISIPTFLTKTDNLCDDASSIQYKNAQEEFFLIVVDESISEIKKALIKNGLIKTYPNDIKGYSSLMLKNLEERIIVYRKSEIIDTLVNNMPAVLLTMSAKFQNVNVFLSLAYIQGKEKYYYVMSYTALNKKKKYCDVMRQIAYSIAEI